MSDLSFMQRFGLNTKLITDDFPLEARSSLAHIFADLARKNYLEGSGSLLNEIRRVRGISRIEFQSFDSESAEILESLSNMEWQRIYQLCERIFSRCLCEEVYEQDDGWVVRTNIGEVRKYYSEEINTLLSENNIAYEFVDGMFQRRGRAQTQKMKQRVGTVLSQPRLFQVRELYGKALRFYEMVPDPDSTNCIKEALCAFEACIEVLTTKKASNDFVKVIRQLQGNDPKQIPPPIAEGMIRLYGYRGGGEGIAHAAIGGDKVSVFEAELVLNLTASYITYLADLLPEEDEIPF